MKGKEENSHHSGTYSLESMELYQKWLDYIDLGEITVAGQHGLTVLCFGVHFILLTAMQRRGSLFQAKMC